MEVREQAYRHRSEITGVPSGDDPATEHQDTASGSAEERNEIEVRKSPDDRGTSTGDDTRLHSSGE